MGEKEQDMGACLSAPGSREPSPAVSAASGFDPSRNTLYCSFCGKSQHDVAKLIAGPTAFICDECVFICVEICGAEKLFPARPGLSLFELAGRLKTFCAEYGIKDEGSLALVASMCWTLGVEPSINMARRDSDRNPKGGDSEAAPSSDESAGRQASPERETTHG